jgi:hypothetical protein
MKRTAEEKYAALPDGGYVYAVLRRGVERPDRYHDARSLEQLEEVLDATPPEGRGLWLPFTGVAVSQPAQEGQDAMPASTHAGRVLVSELAGLRYWSPVDEAASERAYEAAEAVLDALAQAAQATYAAASGGFKVLHADEDHEAAAAADASERLPY